MKYIVDIDGTICNTSDGDYKNSKPYIHRIQIMNRLYDEGHEIHYWTARGSNSGTDWYDLTLSQLKMWKCKFHSLKTGKPAYDLWIDDKSINSSEFFRQESITEMFK